MNESIPFHALLTHPEVTDGICGALVAGRFKKQDLQDGVQDVYVKVLTAFSQGTPVPADVGGMRALCATVAKNHAIDRLRKADTRKHDSLEEVRPEEHWQLQRRVEQRDPVDTGRQLEVLAQLFREGRMPEDGVDILEGVASSCTHEEVGEDLGISDQAVKGRLSTMRSVFRARMAKLGMLPGMQPLRVIVSAPSAIATLRQAA
jgi:RNA polymerase sigma factor (sigma-70 family)